MSKLADDFILNNINDYFDYFADNGMEPLPEIKGLDDLISLVNCVADESMGSNEAFILILFDLIKILDKNASGK